MSNGHGFTMPGLRVGSPVLPPGVAEPGGVDGGVVGGTGGGGIEVNPPGPDGLCAEAIVAMTNVHAIATIRHDDRRVFMAQRGTAETDSTTSPCAASDRIASADLVVSTRTM